MEGRGRKASRSPGGLLSGECGGDGDVAIIVVFVVPDVAVDFVVLSVVGAVGVVVGGDVHMDSSRPNVVVGAVNAEMFFLSFADVVNLKM